MGLDPDTRPEIVGVVASEIHLDGPASLRNSSNGEVEKLNAESRWFPPVACDSGVNGIFSPRLEPSSAASVVLRGDWVGNSYSDFHLFVGFRTSTTLRAGPAAFLGRGLDPEYTTLMFTAESNGPLSETSSLPPGV